jgi:hypothetical protein
MIVVDARGITRRDAISVLTASAAAKWLRFAAAPTFAIMALLTGVLGGGPPDMLCAGAQDASALSGMVPMYVLMSAFHSAPWLKLIFRPAKRWPPVLVRRSQIEVPNLPAREHSQG